MHKEVLGDIVAEGFAIHLLRATSNLWEANTGSPEDAVTVSLKQIHGAPVVLRAVHSSRVKIGRQVRDKGAAVLRSLCTIVCGPQLPYGVVDAPRN